MSERKYQTRPPVYIDLASDSWKSQPRDSHGRWAKTGGMAGGELRSLFDPGFTAASHDANTLLRAQGLGSVGDTLTAVGEPTPKKAAGWKGLIGLKTTPRVTQGTAVIGKHGTSNPEALREFNQACTETQMEMFHASGIHLNFSSKLSAYDLHQMWQANEGNAEERAKILSDMEAHVKMVEVALAAANRDLLDAQRASHGAFYARFDENLAKHAIGRSIINLRQRILTDKVLDRASEIRSQIKEHGLDWAKHAATGVAVGLIVGHLLGPLALVPLAAHFGGSGGGAAMQHIMEGKAFETAMAALVSMHLTNKAFAPIEKALSKERKIERAKKKLKAQARKK